MKTYYIRFNDGNHGPYSLEELKNFSVTPETYVWKEGFTQWLQAKYVDELNSLFHSSTPPPFAGPANGYLNTTFTPAPSTTETIGYYLGKLFKRFKIALIVVLAVVAIYYFNNQSTMNNVDYSAASIIDPEKSNPSEYLHTSGTYHTNLIDQIVIDGTIYNKASHTNYKDVVVRVTFYSNTESVITTKEYKVYDYFPYGGTGSFKLKIEKPAGTKTCGWEAKDATPY